MSKTLVLGLLLAGIGAGAYAFYSEDLHESEEPNASIPSSESEDNELGSNVLYAGNVPCNPAKEVCED